MKIDQALLENIAAQLQKEIIKLPTTQNLSQEGFDLVNTLLEDLWLSAKTKISSLPLRDQLSAEILFRNKLEVFFLTTTVLEHVLSQPSTAQDQTDDHILRLLSISTKMAQAILLVELARQQGREGQPT